jgi:predicted nucleotidyltransferase component of viral defense system
MTEELHLEILPEEQLKLLKLLSGETFIRDFYLAGGTGLALYLGHRQSFDFDFFIPTDFDTSQIVNILNGLGKYERGNEEKNTVNGLLNGVRVSFLGYKYDIIDEFSHYQSIRLAGIRDIASMKLEAIAGRGSKKDFVDMYFLLNQFSLEEIFSFHALKYGVGLNNQYHHLKSLVYFNDADEEAMPLMTNPLNWDMVKAKIRTSASKFQS